MTSCRDIQERAAYLAALPQMDPERKLAIEHARNCAQCAQALAEGERVIAMIDQLPPPPPPTEVALRRASEAILRDLKPDESLPVPLGASGPKVFVLAVPILAAWSIAVGLAKRRAMDPDSWLWSAAILGASVLGIAGLMRFNAAVTGVAVVLSGAFSALMGSGGMLSPAIGVKCVVIELIAASLPLATTAFLVATGRVVGSPWRFAAVAALGALAGHAGLHLTCPVHTATPHLLVFHTGGVMLAAVLGLMVSRVPALRPRH